MASPPCLFWDLMHGNVEGSTLLQSGRSAGPTVGWFEDLGKAVSGFATGEVTQPDVHRVRRLAPFQNHWAISYGLTALEESLGLPERQPAKPRQSVAQNRPPL